MGKNQITSQPCTFFISIRLSYFFAEFDHCRHSQKNRTLDLAFGASNSKKINKKKRGETSGARHLARRNRLWQHQSDCKLNFMNMAKAPA